MPDTEEEMPVAAKRRPMVRVEKRPLCPKHGDTMCAYSTHERRTYYICRTDDCDAGEKGRRYTTAVPRRRA